MSTATEEILEGFDQLNETEQRELAGEILKRTGYLDLSPLDDEELVLAAEDLFLELDRSEAKDA